MVTGVDRFFYHIQGIHVHEKSLCICPQYYVCGLSRTTILLHLAAIRRTCPALPLEASLLSQTTKAKHSQNQQVLEKTSTENLG
jgi:hypothetical protein